MGEPVGTLPTLGGDSLALSFVSLGLVCLLAYLALRFLAGRGARAGDRRGAGAGPLPAGAAAFGLPDRDRRPLLPVGVGEGPMALLAEVDGAKVESPAETGPPRVDSARSWRAC